MLGHGYKSLIGKRPFNYWPFTIVDDGDGQPVIEVQICGKSVRKTPVEVSAEVLKRVKQNAEEYLKEEVKHAVITVPAKFEQVN